MKTVIASDIHGSLPALSAVFSAVKRENADLLVLLGDLYYHGPRNPLPEGYAPMKVAEALNAYPGKFVAVRGNCDAAVDQTVSAFSFCTHFALTSKGKTVFLTHGDVYSPENPPKGFDILINGHFHTALLGKRGDLIVANPGSPALPKGGTAPSYLVLDEGALTLKTLAGETEEILSW